MPRKVRLGQQTLPEGELKGFEEAGRLICLAHTRAGLRAIDDWCNHAGCLLSGGRIEPAPGGGEMVVCSCHEIGFDLVTGKKPCGTLAFFTNFAAPITSLSEG